MLCITALAIVALFKGIDGVFLASALAVLGGLGGYSVRQSKSVESTKTQAVAVAKTDNGVTP